MSTCLQVSLLSCSMEQPRTSMELAVPPPAKGGLSSGNQLQMPRSALRSGTDSAAMDPLSMMVARPAEITSYPYPDCASRPRTLNIPTIIQVVLWPEQALSFAPLHIVNLRFFRSPAEGLDLASTVSHTTTGHIDYPPRHMPSPVVPICLNYPSTQNPGPCPFAIASVALLHNVKAAELLKERSYKHEYECIWFWLIRC